MKIYKGEFKSYQINELSEKAKRTAYEKWLPDSDLWQADELRATLDEFCKLFDVRCCNWEYDAYNYHYRFEVNIEDGQDELSDIRLAKFVWNNYAPYISKGKYYSLWSKTEVSDRNPNCGKLKKRYSKVMSEMTNCPLTGVCYDYDILEPIIDCLTYKKMYASYSDLIEDCLDRFFSMAKKECEYAESFEYFIDDAEANSWEYDENGNAFRLPTGYREIA